MPRISGVSSLARDPLHTPLLIQSSNKRKNAKALQEHGSRAPSVPRNDLMPQLKLVMVPVGELRLPARRVRKLAAADVQEVANAIAQFGFCDPILIGRDGMILDGESRLEAARKIGLKEVPCILTSHLSESEERAVRIAFNRLGAKRGWDLAELKLELLELDAAGEPIHLLGFESIELDQILAVETKKTNATPWNDNFPDPVVQPGDIWKLGEHMLLCGDATDPESYSRLLRDGQPQLVLTDPPYNVKVADIVSTRHAEFVQGSGEMSHEEFFAFLTAFLSCCQSVLVDGGIVLSFMDWKHIATLIQAGKKSGFELLNVICWIKNSGGMGSLWRSQHELIGAFKKPGKHKNNVLLGAKGRDRTNCWFAPGANTLGSEAREMLSEHPTSKPPELLIEALYDVTDRGDIVLDPFGGSGSTLIAAHRAKRTARLIEMDPHYCDVALRRWLGETGEMPIHVDSGEPYDLRGERRKALVGELVDER